MTTVKMIFVIVERTKTDAVCGIGKKCGAIYTTVSLCRGTASTEILEYLGLGEAERAMVCFIGSNAVAYEILRGLRDELMLSRAGHGVAFTVPLASIGGRRVMEMLMGNPEVNADIVEDRPVQGEYDLIITVVNRGFAESVMAAAHAAGARGGTIVPARGTKKNDEADFLGVAIHPEKDLVLILADRSTRHELMQAIADGAGLKSEGLGFSFALPVSDVAGIAKILL
ncbi:MAG: hypothetical protein LBC65_02325 [Oscillospiraceae bacterium]|nr:hypothetical protein [Oscillospiraceae bacterium]